MSRRFTIAALLATPICLGWGCLAPERTFQAIGVQTDAGTDTSMDGSAGGDSSTAGSAGTAGVGGTAGDGGSGGSGGGSGASGTSGDGGGNAGFAGVVDGGLADAAEEATQETGPETGPESAPDVCVPGTCQSLGMDCGSVSDGCGGTIPSCGTCPANESCGGGGVPHVCGGCVPDTCLAHGYNCGSIPDGCGNTVVCGPAFTPFDYGACESLPPYGWICGSQPDVNKSGPPPYPDCVKAWHGTVTFAYCCPEAS